MLAERPPEGCQTADAERLSFIRLYKTNFIPLPCREGWGESPLLMKKILILLLALLPLAAIQAKPNKQTVVLYCDLHCQGCCDKIMKNIAFEKGVKDIQFDMEQQAVTVTYDANKTDVPTLQKAFAKIGKPATTRKPESADHDHDHEHQGHKH